jgi:hypothetical protein
MAHFARIEDNIVREVIVINNEIFLNENGQEQESIGIAFCKSLFGEETNWIQTSYNASFRGKFAASGDKYDSEIDQFIIPIVPAQ